MSHAPKKRRRIKAGGKPGKITRTGERSFTTPGGARITVRPARPSDSEGIVALYNEVAAEKVHITPEKYPWPPEAEGQLISQMKKEGSGRFVAIKARRVVGECTFLRSTEPKRRHTAVCQVAVAARFRRQGIGRNILEYALKWAKGAGIEKITLDVFATNAAAIALYRVLGFKEEGRRAGQVKIDGRPIDDVLMGKFV